MNKWECYEWPFTLGRIIAYLIAATLLTPLALPILLVMVVRELKRRDTAHVVLRFGFCLLLALILLTVDEKNTIVPWIWRGYSAWENSGVK